MKKQSLFLAGLIAVLLSGCAFVNVPLYTPAQPLREKVIEGEGRTKILLIDISGFISEAEKSRGSMLAEEVPLLSRVKEELQKAETGQGRLRTDHQDQFSGRNRDGVRHPLS